MAALRLNYEGGPEAERRIALANSQLKLLHWKNESVYSFENFKTQLKEHLDTLDELNRGKNAHEKVEMLMEKIQPAQGDKQSDIRTEKILCKAKHPDDFEQAATYMATKICHIGEHLGNLGSHIGSSLLEVIRVLGFAQDFLGSDVGLLVPLCRLDLLH